MSEPQYTCTDCQGDAFIGLTNWKGPEGGIIGRGERLCLPCGRKRGINFSFQATVSASPPQLDPATNPELNLEP